MGKTLIKIKFQNGFLFDTFLREVFEIEGLTDIYNFVESDNPDYIIFGPYGNDIPKKGNYTRIGYFCENIIPDLTICDYAFGVMPETMINNSKYKRIQWHALNPKALIKTETYNIDEIISQKKYFCNFLYSHKVPYREEFFKQLSKYKKVDAPGKSMNNMESIDNKYVGDIWERKKQFLSPYKFTIAFENYVFPGYQTEKLYDAMQMNSIPIYCGDPYIGDIFNTSSFINANDYIKSKPSAITNWIEKNSQMDFIDMLPQFHKTPYHRIKRKVKSIGRKIKMRRQFQNLNFSALIDRVIEIDKNPEEYLKVLNQPWFINNLPPQNVSLRNRWIEIFSNNPPL